MPSRNTSKFAFIINVLDILTNVHTSKKILGILVNSSKHKDCTLTSILVRIAQKEIKIYVQLLLALAQVSCQQIETRLLCRKSLNYSELFNGRIEKTQAKVGQKYRSQTPCLEATTLCLYLCKNYTPLLAVYFSLQFVHLCFSYLVMVKYHFHLTIFMHIINLVKSGITSRIVTERNKKLLTIVVKIQKLREHRLEKHKSLHIRGCRKLPHVQASQVHSDY